MRLIDADALEAFVKTVRQGLYLDKTLSDMPTRDSMLLNFQQYVHLQPTIAAMPVVRGEWIRMDKTQALLSVEWKCSQCGQEIRVDGILTAIGAGWKYCPNAKKMEDKP